MMKISIKIYPGLKELSFLLLLAQQQLSGKYKIVAIEDNK